MAHRQLVAQPLSDRVAHILVPDGAGRTAPGHLKNCILLPQTLLLLQGEDRDHHARIRLADAVLVFVRQLIHRHVVRRLFFGGIVIESLERVERPTIFQFRPDLFGECFGAVGILLGDLRHDQDVTGLHFGRLNPLDLDDVKPEGCLDRIGDGPRFERECHLLELRDHGSPPEPVQLAPLFLRGRVHGETLGRGAEVGAVPQFESDRVRGRVRSLASLR